MTHDEMLHLIEQSGLQIVSVYPHRRYYGVCLQVGGRFQNDELSFTKEDFDAMTTQQAQEKIEYSRADMARAAKTKQGLLSDSEEAKEAKKAKLAVNKRRKSDEKTVAAKEAKVAKKGDGDVEKALRAMRRRGNSLAKTVRYR